MIRTRGARRTQLSRGASVLVALTVAAGLTFGSAVDRRSADVADVSELVPVPDPAAASVPLRALERAPDPGPSRSPSGASTGSPSGVGAQQVGPHARLRSATKPLLLHIEDLGVLAPIEQVGVLADGGMEIPDDIGVVGWYATDHRRVSPGDPGTAVIAGHRDSRKQGLGALHDLVRLRPGATIDIVHADGLISRWTVEETLMTPRDALPADVLFAREGAPRLALVTCGGTFDEQTRSYSHNTIVLAQLATGERDER
jgi:hypothetical protein